MLDRLFGKHIHQSIHLLGLVGLAVGTPLNKVVMSLAMMLLVLNLVLKGTYSKYWLNLKSNKLLWLIVALFVLHIIGLIWTTDFNGAMNDLRVKLPFLVIPVVVVAYPLTSKNQLDGILLSFTLTVVLLSLINFAMYKHWIGHHVYDDIRGMSLFGSHVRFGIIVSFATGVLLYFLKDYKKYRPVIVGIMGWLIFYTYYSQVISGLSTLIGVLMVFILYLLWGRMRWLAVSILIATATVCILTTLWLFKPIHVNNDMFANLPEYSKEGNEYLHYNSLVSPETEMPIYINVCDKELKRDWHLYSNVPYDSTDAKGQPIRFTLLRYMSSKGLNKDAEGLKKLNESEVKLIEMGIGSVYHSGIKGRLYGIKYQLVNNQDPNGNSLLERFEYWKAGWNIFTSNIIIGVGTGDVQHAFDQYYSASSSQLLPENRKRAHNMYLTFGVTFGLIGLMLFLWFNVAFIYRAFITKNILAMMFLAVAMISYLAEDTLETQTGVTFCGLFYGLFAIQIKKDNETL